MKAKGSTGAWDEWMGIQLECQYEEDLTKQPEARVRWYEAAGGTTLWEMTTDPVPPSMFAGYHYTVDPKRPGYDGLWGTHPEFGLMRGTENIIGTVRSRRPTSVPSLQYDSCPSHEVVGSFFSIFE